MIKQRIKHHLNYRGGNKSTDQEIKSELANICEKLSQENGIPIDAFITVLVKNEKMKEMFDYYKEQKELSQELNQRRGFKKRL